MSRQLIQHIVPQTWDSQKPVAGSGTQRVRYLQDVNDVINRPVTNRQTASSNTTVAANGSNQSTGIGTGKQQPKKYAEFTVKARVTYNLNASQTLYLYIYRTTGNIPANGAAPNGGDVVVGGGAFAGGMQASGVNQAASFSFLDTGLSVSQQYRYYLGIAAPNGTTVTILSSSIIVMERC